MTREVLAERVAFVRQVGLPENERPGPQVRPPATPRSTPKHPVQSRCLALIATRNYLPYALVAARTFREHHPEIPAFLLLVDGKEEDAALFPEGTVVLLADLQLAHAGWYAAKFSASEFANGLKPVFLAYLARLTQIAIYLDCDIAVFSRFDEMLRELESSDLVLTPHMLRPLPRPEQFHVRPSRSDIFNSGLINAGCFGIRLQACQDFLRSWEEANFAPGAFFTPAGYQTDQQHLNWALVSVPTASVLREPRYNVAYWNLHERDLWIDDETEGLGRYQVDDKPLAFFHFSGYDVSDRLRLSRHDHRNSVYNLPAVAELLNWYSDQIVSSPARALLTEAYRFDELANGLHMNALLRDLLKRYENYFPKFDATTEQGADRLCAFLMDPLPAARSLLPLIAAEIYDRRDDLRAQFPGAHVAATPSRYWHWFCHHAGVEFDVQLLIDRFRRTLMSDSIIGFADEIARLLGTELKFLGIDRRLAAERLRSLGRPDLADSLSEAKPEWCFFTDIAAILDIYERRTDLHGTFDDVLGTSHDAFLEWLSAHAPTEHRLPPAAAEDFATRTSSGCLARIFSYLARHPHLESACQSYLLADDAEPLLRDLIAGAGEGLEYDLSDVVILRYIHATRRHLLVPLYLELPSIRRLPNASRVGSFGVALLPEQVRLAPWAKRGCALHAACFDEFDAHLDGEMRVLTQSALASFGDVFKLLSVAGETPCGASPLDVAYRRAMNRLPPEESRARNLLDRLNDRSLSPAVNIFGYFNSDIGVGESSRGLARAVAQHRAVNPIPYHTSQIRAGTQLPDMFGRFDYLSDTNVFVSYPHQREDLLGLLPPEHRRGRRNVAHLAWEQRVANPLWRVVYDRYDAIWVISEFAATPFRRMFPDRVTVVPNVLDFEDFPVCDELETTRLTRDVLRFLFIFDANSSIERKNPEAVITAFVNAFKDTPDARRVELILKVGGMHRPEHSARVEHLMQLAHQSGLAIRFDGRQLSRRELLRLIAGADCYVSLHRAEGFGYTMAEAMAYGVPVIASGYSGNLEYMSAENSFLVPCREAFVKSADGPFQRGSVWGEPDLAAAIAWMRWIAERPADAVAVGREGRKSVRAKLTAAAVSETIADYFK